MNRKGKEFIDEHTEKARKYEKLENAIENPKYATT